MLHASRETRTPAPPSALLSAIVSALLVVAAGGLLAAAARSVALRGQPEREDVPVLAGEPAECASAFIARANLGDDLDSQVPGLVLPKEPGDDGPPANSEDLISRPSLRLGEGGDKWVKFPTSRDREGTDAGAIRAGSASDGLPQEPSPPLPAPTEPDPFPPLSIPAPVQTLEPVAAPQAVVPIPTVPAVAPDGRLSVEQVTGLFPSPGGCGPCGTADGCNQCRSVPNGGGFVSRLYAAFADALLCPDPCYKPMWTPLADTAFYTDSARPVTHTRLRWEYTQYGKFLDRGEYVWARADGNGRGPRPVAGVGIPRVDTHELQQYTETAAGPKFSAFVATPYRSLNITNGNPSSAAGFGDLTIGTKSVLFDSELAILTLQFKTILPIGNAAKGLGTGHVSLEPSLLFGLKVSPDSYLQGQLAEWIPIAGDPTFSGAMLHYHLAYNHVLWRPASRVQLVGTFELNGYSWQDGGFTDPATGFRSASGSNILQLGPGVRVFYGDQYDFGVGSNFGVTGKNSIGDQFRFEMRLRY